MRTGRWVGGLMAAAAAAGCANVHVKKVPVELRAAGQDHHVHGFRYYLTRPYIVVSRRIELGDEVVPVHAFY